MSTWRVTIEYDGRRFSGWQRQAGARTVQEEVETALARFFGGDRVITHAAGRTDAGVHALGQVASFRVDVPRDPAKLVLALNTFLPEDCAVRDARVVEDGFHARISAKGKLYRYLVWSRPERSPFWVGRAWYVRRPVDWAKVDAALAMLVGTHEFKGFRAAACVMKRTVRTITRVERDEPEPFLHRIEFEGPGFLRYQVRIMVGTALDVGMGRRTLDDVRAALETGDRERAGRTAPPDGLYLVEVRY
ncbi:MAG: tRNA pseudouridine(38-40) synthase TruA [Myxococcota bacterium]